MVKHLAVSNWPRSLSETFPIGGAGEHVNSDLFRSFASQLVCTACRTVNQQSDGCFDVNCIERRLDKFWISEISTTRNKNTHLNPPFSMTKKDEAD